MTKPDRPQSLTRRVGNIGGIIGGLLGIFFIGPALFPRTPGQFNLAFVVTAGVCGALGAIAGSMLGAMIEVRSKK